MSRSLIKHTFAADRVNDHLLWGLGEAEVVEGTVFVTF